VTAARYAASLLAPSTETGSAVLCTHCGALVADTAVHDKFHAALRQAASVKPKGETRGK
jgi:hypothetical protein